MNKILLAGGTGFIGKHLMAYLIEKGFELSVLTRRKMKNRPNVKYFQWEIDKKFIDEKAFEKVDAIINLTGANIGAKRWTKKRKQEIINSRVTAIDLLFHYVLKNKYPVKHFITSSATGYYGAVTTDRIFTENDPEGDDFLASVCQKWENRAQQFEGLGCRTVILRQGVVLGKEGSFYQKMAPLARKGINPAVGNGKQYLPWIDVRDLVRLYDFILENDSMQGIFNAVASEQITMNVFARKLLKSFGKKSILPNVPSFLIRLALGEMSKMVLEGSRVSNRKIKSAGFTFLYDDIEKSLY